MGNEMIAYLQRLEIAGFFSGYPLVYALVTAIRGNAAADTSIKKKMFMLLPFVYAFTGILYTGLQLRNFYPNYSFDHFAAEIQIPFYVLWGLSSVFFFLPSLSKKPFISLLHSLVFFFLLIRSYYLEAVADVTDKTVLKNYMRVYFDSILLIIAILIILLITYVSARYLRKKTQPAR